MKDDTRIGGASSLSNTLAADCRLWSWEDGTLEGWVGGEGGGFDVGERVVGRRRGCLGGRPRCMRREWHGPQDSRRVTERERDGCEMEWIFSHERASRGWS